MVINSGLDVRQAMGTLFSLLAVSITHQIWPGKVIFISETSVVCTPTSNGQI